MSGIVGSAEKFLSTLPAVDSAFLYGSSLLNPSPKNQVDLILAVKDAVNWHSMNVSTNRKHYSFLRYFGTSSIASIQQNWGAGVYYNTQVPFDGQYFKYGVVTSTDLVQDLYDWKHLFLAGRLQKPVKRLKWDENLEKPFKANLRSALAASFLMLPPVVSEETLFHSLASLSYLGDLRVGVGIDGKRKTNQIVSDGVDGFRKLYFPIIAQLKHTSRNSDGSINTGSQSLSARREYLSMLPNSIRKYVYNELEREVDMVAMDLTDISRAVQKSIRYVVKKSSFHQALQGILTAGGRKSIMYVSTKLQKSLFSG